MLSARVVRAVAPTADGGEGKVGERQGEKLEDAAIGGEERGAAAEVDA